VWRPPGGGHCGAVPGGPVPGRVLWRLSPFPRFETATSATIQAGCVFQPLPPNRHATATNRHTATPPHLPPPRACQSPLTGRAQFARCAICATSRPNWFDIDRARRFPVDSVTRMGYHSDDPHPPSSRKPWAPVTRPGQGCLRALAWGPVGSPFLGLPGAHGPYPGTGRPQAWAGP